jgi:hypothetical protein
MLEALNWTASKVHPPAVDAVQNAANHPVGGLLIFWSFFSSGKAWAMRDLTRRMQLEGPQIATHLHLDGKSPDLTLLIVDGKSPDSALLIDGWLRRSLGMPAVGDIAEPIPRKCSTTEANRSTKMFRDLARQGFDSRQNFFGVVMSVPKIHLIS